MKFFTTRNKSGGSTKTSKSNKKSSKTGLSDDVSVTEQSMSSLSVKVRKDSPSRKSANLKCVEAWLDNMNNFTDIESFLACFTSKDSKMQPEDFGSFSAEMLAHLVHSIHKSFPDVTFQFSGIKESPSKPNMVVVEGLYCSGTHTGAPFSHMPGFPPIPATGKSVQNDEENFYITLVNNKIELVEIVAYGTLTGPAGLYEQIGGNPNRIAVSERKGVSTQAA